MQQGGAMQMQPMQHSLRQPTYGDSLFQSPFAANSPSPTQPHPLTTPPPPYNQYTPYGYQPQQGAPQMYQQPMGGVAPAASPTYLSSGSSWGTTSPPTVDRSTKPDSFKALSTGWGGESWPVNCVCASGTPYLVPCGWPTYSKSWISALQNEFADKY